MADTIEEKKAELESAGYEFFQDTNAVRHPAYVQAPDEWKYYAGWPTSYSWLDEGDRFEREQLEDMVTKAHAHLVEKRQSQAMRDFVEMVANTSYFAEDKPMGASGNYTLSVGSFDLAQIVKAAQKLLGKE